MTEQLKRTKRNMKKLIRECLCALWSWCASMQKRGFFLKEERIKSSGWKTIFVICWGPKKCCMFLLHVCIMVLLASKQGLIIILICSVTYSGWHKVIVQ